MSENSIIVKNSLILYIRLIIFSIIGLLSSRFILQSLGASDFGLYNVVGGIVFMMAFLNNVMISTTYRYLAFELGVGDIKKINSVFNISLVIHIFLAFLLIVFAETIGIYYIKKYLNLAPGKLDDALFVFRLSIVGAFVSILSIPYQGLITAKEKFSIIAAIEIFRNFLALGAVILLLFFSGNRLRLYSILIAVISTIPPLLYFFYSRYQYASLIKWNFQKSKRKYREIVGYSSWILFGAFASAGEIQGSVLIINLFFGTILNASYGIANQVNNMVKMFSQSLNQAVIPQITKSFSVGNTDRTMQLVIFSSKYSFLLMLIPSLPILLETKFILKLWLNVVPEYTSIFIQLMIINALIATANAGIPAAVHATGKIKYFQIILSTIGLIGIPISYLLFKAGFPPFTLLITYLIIAIISLFVMQVLLKQLIQFNIREFFNRAYLKMILVSAAIVPLFLIRNIFKSSMLRFIGITSLSIIWLLTAIYFLGTERIEKEALDRYTRNLFIKHFKK